MRNENANGKCKQQMQYHGVNIGNRFDFEKLDLLGQNTAQAKGMPIYRVEKITHSALSQG